ncbi:MULTISPECIES: hypothetical protein [Neisseria]|uniref:hypothetical protein n=1 Tax=Neisseria TaxID=482 RepID=UPI001431B885|nr:MULTISPECIES: hypothetical protein [Neisseria]MBF0803451.1 hypothetical protein [Neisseria sp. 19428wB4_WF04]
MAALTLLFAKMDLMIRAGFPPHNSGAHIARQAFLGDIILKTLAVHELFCLTITEHHIKQAHKQGQSIHLRIDIERTNYSNDIAKQRCEGMRWNIVNAMNKAQPHATAETFARHHERDLSASHCVGDAPAARLSSVLSKQCLTS